MRFAISMLKSNRASLIGSVVSTNACTKVALVNRVLLMKYQNMKYKFRIFVNV